MAGGLNRLAVTGCKYTRQEAIVTSLYTTWWLIHKHSYLDIQEEVCYTYWAWATSMGDSFTKCLLGQRLWVLRKMLPLSTMSIQPGLHPGLPLLIPPNYFELCSSFFSNLTIIIKCANNKIKHYNKHELFLINNFSNGSSILDCFIESVVNADQLISWLDDNRLLTWLDDTVKWVMNIILTENYNPQEILTGRHGYSDIYFHTLKINSPIPGYFHLESLCLNLFSSHTLYRINFKCSGFF